MPSISLTNKVLTYPLFNPQSKRCAVKYIKHVLMSYTALIKIPFYSRHNKILKYAHHTDLMFHQCIIYESDLMLNVSEIVI